MKKFRILIDIDDVLNNLNERCTQVFNKTFGTELTADTFSDYDIFKCLPFEQATEYCRLWNDAETLESLTPIKNSQWGVKHFTDEGYDVYIATATHADNFALKVDWLHSLFPFIDDSHIIRCCDKSVLYADVMIDDCAKNLISNIHCERVLLNMPWNQNVHDEVYGIYRCNDWNEIVATVDDIYKNTKELMNA